MNRTIATTAACLMSMVALTGCGGQDGPTPPRATSSGASETASPACVRAMRDRLAAAPYTPDAPVAQRLEECAEDSDEAIQATAEQLLREAFPSPGST